MKKIIYCLILTAAMQTSYAQQTVFEKSGGLRTATYFEAISYYKNLAKSSGKIKVLAKGMSDAGYPLHVVLVDNDKKFDPVQWHRAGKVVILINNGIHPGEPDGIDASMMLVRDIMNEKVKLPSNIALAIIPVYNIGGSLNRFQLTRVSQNGPEQYGFRGNAQNLDLNRDFTKCDSKNARTFTSIFHWLNPDIFIDNHVSDGADYQHVITLISTQYDKLGPELGKWMKESFDPGLYKKMKDKNRDMVPYVNVEGSDPSVGYSMFYDPPRYSSGYGALFQTLSYMPETHMLKPYKERVYATYDFMITMMQNASEKSHELITQRRAAVANVRRQKFFPLRWTEDTSRYSLVNFKGYTASTKPSGLSDQKVLYYDHNKPYVKEIKFFDAFKEGELVTKPAAYVIPQGWWSVIDLLKLNMVKMHRLSKDTTIKVTVYHITSLKSMPFAYEKHHRNSQVKYSKEMQDVHFLKGDYYIPTGQIADRFLVEMLEPDGDDSYFSWNFFDAILQQKEYFSDYRWNDIAVEYLNSNPELKKEFESRLKSDSSFSGNLRQQLAYIYERSTYYESAFRRYPVYRIDKPSR